MSFMLNQITLITLFLINAFLIKKAKCYNFKITNTNQTENISNHNYNTNNSTSSQELSAFINFDNGDYIIFYENNSKNSYKIKIIKYNSENTKIAENQLNNNMAKQNSINEINPKALLLYEETFVLQWQSHSAFSNQSRNEAVFALNAQIFDKNLNAISKPFLLSKEKTLFSSGKALVKISKFLFAVVYAEYLRDSNSYSVGYSVFCVNGISVRNESLFVVKEKYDVNVNYMNETALIVSFLSNEQQQENDRKKDQNKALNVTYINHNGIEFDKFVLENKKINVTEFAKNSYNANNSRVFYSELISGFNFLFAKANKLFGFTKYTTTNNLNLMTFPKSKILFYNQNYLNIKNTNNSTNSTINYNNNDSTNNPNIININKYYDLNSTNIIAIISYYENFTTSSFNSLTYSNAKNNSYLQLDILDFDLNYIFTKHYKIDNACCFEPAVFNDNSFVIAYQFFYDNNKNLNNNNSKMLSQIAYAEFNADLGFKAEGKNVYYPKIILPQLNSQAKMKPRVYAFEKTKNSLYDKKLIFGFNAIDANKLNAAATYELFFSTQDCRESFCADEVVYSSSCEESCESCIADPLVCRKCAAAHFPLLGEITSNPDFEFLNPSIANSTFNYNNSINNNNNNNNNTNSNNLNNFLIPSKTNGNKNKNDLSNYYSKNAFNCFKIEASLENSYFDSSISAFIKCDSSCNSCANAPSMCTKCTSGFYPLENNNKKCVQINYTYDTENKQAYFFESKSSTMRKCSLECRSCAGSAENCSECNNEQGFFSISEASSICHKNPNGFYLDLKSKIYRKCIENCLKCEDYLSCLVCDGFSTISFDGSKCFYCGEGMFYDEKINKCRDCAEVGHCSSCNALGCFECLKHFEFKPVNALGVSSNLINQGN